MKLTGTLARKVGTLALMNILSIVLAGLAFGFWRYGLSPESLLLAPSRPKVEAFGAFFDRQVNQEGQDVEAVLKRWADEYSTTFTLIDPDGVHLAGTRLELPQRLIEEMRRSGPGRPGMPKGGGKNGDKKRGQRPSQSTDSLPLDGPLPEGPPPDSPGKPPSWREAQAGAARRGMPQPRSPSFFAITTSPLSYWAGLRTPYRTRQGEETPSVLLIRGTSLWSSQVFTDFREWMAIVAGLGLISALCWAPFLGKLTRDVGKLQQATRHIADGRFDVDVPQERSDEVGQLGTQVGRMAARLDHFVKHQKRFLGDIAHELSAPMARIQFALGILEQKADESQAKHVDRLRREIEEMSGLVNELLQFSRAEVMSGAMEREPLDVGGLITRAVTREDIPSAQLQVSVEPELKILGNEVYLVRAVANVLRNALRYAGHAGPIEVFAKSAGKNAVIEVSDSGPGLEPELLERIFEPFFRPESDRSRQTGGSGLGLAIVRTCVEACGGAVNCENRKPNGLTVRFTFERA